MKRKFKISAIIALILTLSFLTLAPFLFQKTKDDASGSADASNEKPAHNAAKPTETIAKSKTEPAKLAFKDSEMSKQKITPSDNPSEQPPVTKVPQRNDQQTPTKVKGPENVDKPQTEAKIEPKTEQPKYEKRSEKSQENIAKDSGHPASRWSITAMAGGKGLDAGLGYQVAKLPLLGGTDLDVMAGLKEAGIGVSRSVNNNLGLGLFGSVSYQKKEGNLGVYLKYGL